MKYTIASMELLEFLFLLPDRTVDSIDHFSLFVQFTVNLEFSLGS